MLCTTPIPALPAPSTTNRCLQKSLTGWPWIFSAPMMPASTMEAVPWMSSLKIRNSSR